MVTTRKRALCVGINTYPDAPLNGCVNDANGWAALLTAQGYDTTLLTDASATKPNVTAALMKIVGRSKPGDRIVFTYSGHGTWLPDIDGDELDGRDEALALYDYRTGGILLDDQLRAIWDARAFNVRVTTFSDSCFSGTVSRFVGGSRTARFLSPLTFLIPDTTMANHAAHIIRAGYPPNPKAQPRDKADTILYSGCSDVEVSYDTYMDGQWCGAFTHEALTTYAPGDTNRRWHQKIRAGLPNKDYPQTPELTASLYQRYSKAL